MECILYSTNGMFGNGNMKIREGFLSDFKKNIGILKGHLKQKHKKGYIGTFG